MERLDWIASRGIILFAIGVALGYYFLVWGFFVCLGYIVLRDEIF